MKTHPVSKILSLWVLLLCFVLAFSGCVGLTSVVTGTTPEGTSFPDASSSADASTAASTTAKASDDLIDLLAESGEIPEYKTNVLTRMDFYYRNYYVGNLGTPAELAEAILGYWNEYRSEIDESDPDEVTDLLCECYLAAAGDRYAYYMDPEALADYNSDLSGNYVGIGVQVSYDAIERTITVTAVFPDTPADEAGVLAGDRIEAVGDTPITEISFYEAVNRIRGEEGTPVTLTMSRDDEPYTCTMIRRSVVQVTAMTRELTTAPEIGVLRIYEFDETTEEQFKTALDGLLDSGVSGIIFDVRNNPGGLLTTILHILDYLVPDGTPLASYLYYDGSKESDSAKDGHQISSTLPIAVLCNENTASAGELFTCALQDYGREGLLNVTVIGTVTYGKGTMQTMLSLPAGRATTISIALYNPPYSENYEGKGVTPDTVVELGEELKNKSIYRLTEEEDAQLQAAIAAIRAALGAE